MALAEIIEVKYAINLLSTLLFEEIPYLDFIFFSSSQIKVIPEYA